MKRISNGASDSKDAAVNQPDRKPGFNRWRRKLALAACFLASALLLFSLSAAHFYRNGSVDRLIAQQLIAALAPYGLRAEVGRVETKLSPHRVYVSNLALYHAQTGAKLAQIGRLTAAVRIEDLFALSLSRNIVLESLELEEPEIWLAVDAQGRTNFAGLKLPLFAAQQHLQLPDQHLSAPDTTARPDAHAPNRPPLSGASRRRAAPTPLPTPTPASRRLLFSYGAARVALRGGLLHFTDAQHSLAGELRQVRATLRPEQPDSARYAVELACFAASFSAAGRTINDLSLLLAGQLNSSRAVINELRLSSPVAALRANGLLSNWRAPVYELQTESTIALAPLVELYGKTAAQPGTGRLVAAVKGQGTSYRVDGKFTADALTADDWRAETINVNAAVSGQGASYQAQGDARAASIATGGLQLSQLQLAGAVTGVGTAWRWLGSLRAAAAGNGQTSAAAVHLRGAEAEMHSGVLSGAVAHATAASLSLPQARAEQPQASGVKFGSTRQLSVKQARAALVTLAAAQLKDVTVSELTASKRADATRVALGDLRLSGVQAEAARARQVKVAGAQLVFRDSGVSGATGTATAALVTLKNGRLNKVRLEKPSFVLEPQGRYRADAALSLHSGVVNKLELGQVRGQLAANNEEVRLRNFTAKIFSGTATGDALLSATPPATRPETRWTLAGGYLEKAFRAVTRRGAQMSLHLQLAWRLAWR